MKPDLKTQLSTLKLDTSDYGNLPTREDVLLFSQDEDATVPIQKQWEKLNIIRKNLKIVDRYLQDKKSVSVSLGEWARANKEQGISKVVLDKIGGHNNATGGISAYFFNLQNFYDDEEQKYDVIEENASLPKEVVDSINLLANDRNEKRKTRRKVRKLKMKDLKNDGKGYLVVEESEEEKKPSADGVDAIATSNESTETAAADENGVENKSSADPITPEVKAKISKAGKVIISIAGATIAIGVGIALYTNYKTANQ